MTTTTHRTCPLCEATCGLTLTLDGESVTRVEGDAEDVFSRGFICPKGAALGRLHEDPDRLTRPMKREGDRWVEVSWEAAFALISEKLSAIVKTHGRDAVGIYLGNPTVHNVEAAFYTRPLLKALQTKNIYSASTLDQMPKHVSSALMFGHPLQIPVPDLDRTDLLLMLGANPLASNGSLCTAPDFPGRLKALQARGGRFIVVDPRRTRTAKRADAHHFIRPGGDVFLLAALAQTLFAENLVSLNSLDVNGVEALSEAVARFTPEVASTRCGIDAETIRGLARALAEAKRAAVYGRLGTCTVEHGTVTSWLIDALNVLTGNLDRAGGAMFSSPAHERHRPGRSTGGRGYALGRWSSRVDDLPETMGELPVTALASEIETPGAGQIRAFITIAGNPILSAPNADRLDKALRSLDFMVSVDPYCNETTRHADVILPPPSPLHRGHYDLSFYEFSVRNICNHSPPVWPLPEERLAEWEIIAKLAIIAAGQDSKTPASMLDEMVIQGLVGQETSAKFAPLFGESPETLLEALGDRRGPSRILDFLLRSGPYGENFGQNPGGLSLDVLEKNPHGVDLGPLVPRLPDALKTTSGRVELAPAQLVDALKNIPLGDSAPDDRKKLRLIGRRHLRSNNSWMHNIESLAKGKNRCTLLVHPDDADARGLESGALVEVRSRVGSITIPAEITDEIMRGTVSAPHGWGHGLDGSACTTAARYPGVNSNRLTDDSQTDRLSGTVVQNGIPVTVALFEAG